MAERGVTRPMAEHDGNQHQPTQQSDHDGRHTMTQEQRLTMLQMHQKQTLWVYWTLVILGIWVMCAPLTFDYASGTVEPSGGRTVWLSLSTRGTAMQWSDLLSGLCLFIFGWRSLRPNRPVSRWVCCGVGVWLNLAPLLFWAPTAVVYLNDTLVGVLVIALTVLVPGMPNMILYMQMGGQQPPGWSYNPSSWPQRWIMIVTGFAGWLVSRYLAAYQLGYIPEVFDPFFGEGSRLVLNSSMSHAWPISDAGLGALAYTFEFLMGWMGSPARWRTMPWMVTFFGILVIPLGLVHILLVISQPVVVGHWCTLCLLAAAIMLPMIPLEVDEVIAMGQHLLASKRRGESVWWVFWQGGSPEGSTPDERSPELIELPERFGTVCQASLWGMSFPWTLVVSAVLGIWLMAAPGVFGLAQWAAHINHLGGALVLVVAVISMGEVLRAGRYVNVLLGLMVAVLPWFLDGGTWPGQAQGLIVGLLTAGLALPRGPQTEHYGLWDKYVV
jgi:hypothetical protein